jgi:autotransporter-associated beta strand protein
MNLRKLAILLAAALAVSANARAGIWNEPRYDFSLRADSSSEFFHLNSSFSSSNAGPAWLMNALPGANYRGHATQIAAERSGDLPSYTESGPYHMALSDNGWILSRASAMLPTAAPSAPTSTVSQGTGTSGTPVAIYPNEPEPVDGETDWKNAGGTTWSTAANWTAVTGTAPPAPGDVAWFTNTFSAGQPSLASAAVNIAGLYFSSTTSSGYSFTRSTGSFTFTGSATSIGTEVSNATAVAIGANNTSGTNTISGVPILLAPSSGSTSTFFQAAGGTLVLTSTAVISGSGISLNLTGGGTMSFAEALATPNTYSGGTKIAGPTVVNAGTGAIFGTGGLELNSGTYESSSSTLRSLANVVSITGDFTFDSLSTGINEFSGGGSTTGDRLITVNTVTTRFVTNPFTLGGNLTTAGTGRLNFQAGLNLGGADRTITAGATGAGGNQINGAIDSSAAGNKLILAGNNFTINTVTPGATNVVNFDVNATGTITFSGTNTFLGSVTVDAGTVNASSDSALGSSTAATAGLFMDPSAGTATVNFSSTSPAIASLSSSGAGTSNVVLGGVGGTGTTTTLTVGGNNASTTFAGVISDNTPTKPGAVGSLTKTGSGTLTLSGPNTYTGTTTVNGGTLLVNGNQITAAGAVSVNNTGSTLGGTGTIGGAVTINGPATITGATNGTVGTLTLNSTAAFIGTAGNLATYLVDLNSTTSDKLAITGTLNLSTAFDQITFQGTTGAASYTLATYSGLTNPLDTFDTVTNLPAGYTLVYLPTELDLVATPVPEPSTWIGAALALGAIGFTQRRRIRGLIAKRA